MLSGRLNGTRFIYVNTIDFRDECLRKNHWCYHGLEKRIQPKTGEMRTLKALVEVVWAEQ
jgi:hypothetical protein